VHRPGLPIVIPPQREHVSNPNPTKEKRLRVVDVDCKKWPVEYSPRPEECLSSYDLLQISLQVLNQAFRSQAPICDVVAPEGVVRLQPSARRTTRLALESRSVACRSPNPAGPGVLGDERCLGRGSNSADDCPDVRECGAGAMLVLESARVDDVTQAQRTVKLFASVAPAPVRICRGHNSSSAASATAPASSRTAIRRPFAAWPGTSR
jgi:hypothetical protein